MLAPAAASVEKARRSPGLARVAGVRARLASEHGERLRLAFLRAAAEAEEGASLAGAARAVETGDLEALTLAIPWQEAFEVGFAAALRQELLGALSLAGRLEGDALDRAVSKRLFAFDPTDEVAARWAREESARLVSGLSRSRRDALRAILERASRGELTPPEAARLIVRGDVVGLTERDARAVASLRTRLRRQGVRLDRADEQAAAYSRRLLRQRAALIAEYEVGQAQGEAQLAAVRQARAAGLLDGYVLEWFRRSGSTVEDECAELDGEVALPGRPFPTGRDRPPVHPRCECVVVLRRE